MFYYLLYNSSFFKNGGSDKQIKLLIYGTIVYIIFHGLIFSNQYLEKFQNYYWLLFALDMGSIYFIYKNSIVYLYFFIFLIQRLQQHPHLKQRFHIV